MNIPKKILIFFKAFFKYLFLYISVTLLLSGVSFLLLDKALGSLFKQLPGDLDRAVISLITWMFFLLFLSMGMANDANRDAKEDNYRILTYANIFIVIVVILLLPLSYYQGFPDVLNHPITYFYTPFMWLFFLMSRAFFVSNLVVMLLSIAVLLFVYHRAFNVEE